MYPPWSRSTCDSIPARRLRALTSGAVLMALVGPAACAPPWLPWRSIKSARFSANFPPNGQPYGPVSALPPDQRRFGSAVGEDRLRDKRRRRNHALAEAGDGPGTLDPYKTQPSEDAARSKEPPGTKGAATRTMAAQEEGQWPGRLHPPWWWEKPPAWTKELPWWLKNEPLKGIPAPVEGGEAGAAAGAVPADAG